MYGMRREEGKELLGRKTAYIGPAVVGRAASGMKLVSFEDEYPLDME